jgi:hypothetical protein
MKHMKNDNNTDTEDIALLVYMKHMRNKQKINISIEIRNGITNPIMSSFFDVGLPVLHFSVFYLDVAWIIKDEFSNVNGEFEVFFGFDQFFDCEDMRRYFMFI